MKHNICLLVMGVLLSGLTFAFGAQPDHSAEPDTDVIEATIDTSRPVGPFSPVKGSNGGKYNLENGTMEQVRQETVTADIKGQSTLKIRLEPLAVTLLILE